MNRQALLETLHLADLIDRARANEALTRADLARVLDARNPLAAASLADMRRDAVSGVTVTYPVTLRVRAPGCEAPPQNAMLVSHAFAELAGIEATEMQLVGALPAAAQLDQALEIVQPVASARRDLPLRALSADDVAAIGRHDRIAFADVLGSLAKAGVATLDWRPGGDSSPDAVRIHKAAHDAGMTTFAPVTYSRGGVGKAYLDRLWALRTVAEETQGFVSAVLLPDRTEGVSPLEGTSGTEDWLAASLARLALGHVIPHFTVDAHVVGHKLAATLLSCGADDFVGAQAAGAWAPPTDDGPRPLNQARVTKYVIEARRSPVRRDGLFRSPAETAAE